MALPAWFAAIVHVPAATALTVVPLIVHMLGVPLATVIDAPGASDDALTVAVSPIIAGAALKGPADRLLRGLGHESSVVGVARLYRDLAATLVIDEADADLAPAVESEGLRCVVAPTIMSGPDEAAALGRTVLTA